jgi:hypothetical protein
VQLDNQVEEITTIVRVTPAKMHQLRSNQMSSMLQSLSRALFEASRNMKLPLQPCVSVQELADLPKPDSSAPRRPAGPSTFKTAFQRDIGSLTQFVEESNRV